MPDNESIKNVEWYESLRDQGLSEDTAAQIANTSNTNQSDKPFEEQSRQELYNLARKVGIDGRSKMDKEALINALRKK